MTPKEKRYHEYFMDIAERSAKMSFAKRLKVGAVIVRDNRLISTGFNGSPPGLPNECEHYEDAGMMGGTLVTNKETIHAEENAIIFVAKSTMTTEGATMYCTHAPCFPCARLAYGAGIKKFVFSEHYRDDSGLKFLSDNSVEVIHLNKLSMQKETYDNPETQTSHST